MSAKKEKKFRKMHRKTINRIAGNDFKLYHKNVDDIIFKKNLIIVGLAFGMIIEIIINIILILN